MRCGVNLTSPRVLTEVRKLLVDGNADFCEILIDNFLHMNPKEMLEIVGDTPVGFHIMWSRFLERKETELNRIAASIREWIEVLNPVYVSDHLAVFNYEQRLIALLSEIDYQNDFDRVCSGVANWQNMLDCRLLLENFPSTLDKGEYQVGFYKRLINEVNCSLLFDCSNAVVAQLNCSVNATQWLSLAAATSHYHIAGFRKTEGKPSLAIDTHDVNVVSDSYDLLRSILDVSGGEQEEHTIVVERDANLDVDVWKNELNMVRSLQGVAA